MRSAKRAYSGGSRAQSRLQAASVSTTEATLFTLVARSPGPYVEIVRPLRHTYRPRALYDNCGALVFPALAATSWQAASAASYRSHEIPGVDHVLPPGRISDLHHADAASQPIVIHDRCGGACVPSERVFCSRSGDENSVTKNTNTGMEIRMKLISLSCRSRIMPSSHSSYGHELGSPWRGLSRPRSSPQVSAAAIAGRTPRA